MPDFQNHPGPRCAVLGFFMKAQPMTLPEQVRKMGELQAVQTEILERLDEGLGELKAYLIGKPDSPGLVTRVDRLEVCNKNKNKILWLLGGGIIAGIGNWISGKFQ